MASPHAVVVGAGIGGLVTAVSLHRRGWRVTVCERASGLSDLGAGIGLTPNALRALDAIDVGDTVRSRSARQETGGIRRPGGDWIARTDLDFIQSRFGDSVVGLHRKDLLRSFAERLPGDVIHTGITVTAVDPGDRTRRARLDSDAGVLDADLVVSADGIRSVLRTRLFPEHPGASYAGYSSWRLVVPMPAGGVEASETWGRGSRFGIMCLPGGLLHCSATAVTPPRQRHPDEQAEMVRRFGDWHDPIPELITSVDSRAVLHHDVEEFVEPLRAYHRGRVVLVGDSAHPMTPNLGPACLAMEDGVVLGHLLPGHVASDGADLLARLAEYTALRLPRATTLTRRSRRIGAAGQWTSRIAVLARDLGIWMGGMFPPSITGRALDPVVDWWPPTARR